MRKMLLFLSCCFCMIMACTKSDLPPKEVEPTPSVVQHYVFQSITFQLDSVEPPISEVRTAQMTSMTYINNISTTLHAVYQPEILESSNFFINGSLDSLLKTQDTTYLLVPIDVDASNKFVLGGQRWPLSTDFLSRQSAFIEIKDSVQVPPYTTLAITGSLTYKVITADFTASFQGDKDSSLLQYHGRWVGITPIKPTLKYASKDN